MTGEAIKIFYEKNEKIDLKGGYMGGMMFTFTINSKKEKTVKKEEDQNRERQSKNWTVLSLISKK